MREGRPDAIIRVGTLVSSEENDVSIFPTRILLATDGSAQAELATGTAVDLARMFGSELHVAHVLDAAPSPASLYPEAIDPAVAEVSDQTLEKELERRADHWAGGFWTRRRGGYARQVARLGDHIWRWGIRRGKSATWPKTSTTASS